MHGKGTRHGNNEMCVCVCLYVLQVPRRVIKKARPLALLRITDQAMMHGTYVSQGVVGGLGGAGLGSCEQRDDQHRMWKDGKAWRFAG